MATVTISVNCDCCSYLMKVPESRVRRWKYGPRCRSCGKILGLMEGAVVRSKREN